MTEHGCDFEVIAERAGLRVDQLLSAEMGISRGEAQRMLDSGAARINSHASKANYRVRVGDRVTAERPHPIQTSAEAEQIPLNIVFEDQDILVIDKPQGLVVHPAPGTPSGTVVNAVLAHSGDLSGVGGELRPGIVHRLDKDTSGLMVVAKNDEAHRSLQKQIQAKTAKRLYQAILWGVPSFRHAEIDAPIGRHPNNRMKMTVITDSRKNSRNAVTELVVLESLGAFSLVEARLQTGRTHQIRVHCAYIGHPVVGDRVYGGIRKVPSQGLKPSDRKLIEEAIDKLHGQALHAYSLSFEHPRTGKRLVLTAEMPETMRSLLDVVHGVMPTQSIT